MRTKGYLFLALLLMLSGRPDRAGAESPLEQQMKERKYNFQNLYFSNYYEYGRVTLGERNGLWRTFTNDVGYRLNNIFAPYLEAVALDRFGEQDYTLAAGSYLDLGAAGSAQVEAGWGINRDYVYRWQARGEYEHKLINNWAGALGYRYLDYAAGKVNIISPGLIYYFGDNYLEGYYNLAHTAGRGNAQSGVLKANVSVNKYLSAWLGAALGERLYDIYELPAAEQKGYIIFYGVEFGLSKGLSLKIGSSYSQERPNFVNRSLDAGMTIKF